MALLHDPVTDEDLCPKCHLLGCECNAPELISPYPKGPLETQRMVCIACHRTQPCLCKSTLERPSLKTAQTGEPVPPVTPEQKADQDMARFWFERDPAGLRRHLVQLYSSIDRMHKA